MSEIICPFCQRDPFHYVDNGVGMEAVAVICCDLGDQLFRGRRPAPEEVTMSWDEFVEIANRLRPSPPEPAAQAVTENIFSMLEAHLNATCADAYRRRDILFAARAFLTLLPQAGKSEAGWRPIESAESDDIVLVGNPASGTLPVIAWRIQNTWYAYDLGQRKPLDPQPTVWTRWPKLPTPPITSGGGDAI